VKAVLRSGETMTEDKARKGPMPRFGIEHLVYTMMILRGDVRVSRHALAERLDLGEGSVRSVIRQLKEIGMIDVSRRGVVLTAKGESFLDDLGLLFIPVVSEKGKGVFLAATVVKGGADRMGNGMDPLYAAIRAGAEDVSVYVIRNGMMPVQEYMPDFENGRFDVPVGDNAGEGDAVVLCGSPSERTAKLAAVAACMKGSSYQLGET